MKSSYILCNVVILTTLSWNMTLIFYVTNSTMLSIFFDFFFSFLFSNTTTFFYTVQYVFIGILILLQHIPPECKNLIWQIT